MSTKEKSRRSPFVSRAQTRIWQEQSCPDNPWLTESARLHGYALDELITRCDYPSMLYLMLKGELPDPPRRTLMQRLLVGFCSPGPRHPAIRAVMNAAASGTKPPALLPIGLSLMSGDTLGSDEVEQATRFITRQLRNDPRDVASALLAEHDGIDAATGDVRIAPGFGTHYGAVDPYPVYLAHALIDPNHPPPSFDWMLSLHDALVPDGFGCLTPAVFACGCIELGLPPRTASLLYQLAAAPGIAAHAVEKAGKGPTAMPFIDDSDYDMLPTEDAT